MTRRKPVKMLTACASGDRREALEALRDNIAEYMDMLAEEKRNPQAMGTLARRMLDVLDSLDELDETEGKKPQPERTAEVMRFEAIAGRRAERRAAAEG